MVQNLPTDIQIAVTIIGRRKVENDLATNRINLTGADLSQADLRRTDLSKADLRGTRLIGVNFLGANLSKARFDGADFTSANFSGADLSGINDISSLLLKSTFIDEKTILPDYLKSQKAELIEISKRSPDFKEAFFSEQ
jgi:uncharacterized protein YjbI with pentapeptide repeats